MDNTWQNAPAWLKAWPNHINYALFVDESGTASIPRREKSLAEWRKQPQYFALSGILMDKHSYFNELKPAMTDLKSRFWPPEGLFNYPKGPRRVVLHSRDIRRQLGPFSNRVLDLSQLYNAISEMLLSIHFVAYVSVLNLHNLEGAMPTITLPFKDHPYSLAMHFLLERYAQYLRTHQEFGIVVLEARGKFEDTIVLTNMLKLLKDNPRQFDCIKGIYWVPKWAEWDAGKTSFGALEVADLIVYPVFQFVRYQHKTPAFEIVEPKLYGYPDYLSKGLKIF